MEKLFTDQYPYSFPASCPPCKIERKPKVSRFEKYNKDEQTAMSFGYDHACGWFIQIWSTNDYEQPDPDNILVDKDQRFNGITGPEDIIRIAAEHNFTLTYSDFQEY